MRYAVDRGMRYAKNHVVHHVMHSAMHHAVHHTVHHAMHHAMHHAVHHATHRTVHRAMRLRCETQPAERQAVTAFPEIRAFERDAADEFVILACDGIWDVMSSQEAPPSHRSSPPPRIPTPPTRSHSRTSSTR